VLSAAEASVHPTSHSVKSGGRGRAVGQELLRDPSTSPCCHEPGCPRLRPKPFELQPKDPYLVGGEDNHRCPCQDRYPNRGAMASLGAAALECGWPQSIRQLKETHDRRRAPHPPTCTGTHAQNPQPSLLPGGLQAHEASSAEIHPYVDGEFTTGP